MSTRRVEMLSAEEERELILAAQTGDEAAMIKMSASFRPYCVKEAKRILGRIDEDVKQSMEMAVYEAILAYDASKNARFVSILCFKLREILCPMVMESNALLSSGLSRIATDVVRANRELDASGFDGDWNQRIDAITEMLDAPVRATVESAAVAVLRGDVVSLDAPVQEGEGDATIGSMIADADAVSQEDAYEEVERDLQCQSVIRKALSELDDRERQIIAAYHLASDRKSSYRQVAAALGLSAERVRQIGVAAMTKLREIILEQVGSKEAVREILGHLTAEPVKVFAEVAALGAEVQPEKVEVPPQELAVAEPEQAEKVNAHRERPVDAATYAPVYEAFANVATLPVRMTRDREGPAAEAPVQLDLFADTRPREGEPVMKPDRFHANALTRAARSQGPPRSTLRGIQMPWKERPDRTKRRMTMLEEVAALDAMRRRPPTTTHHACA